MQYLMKSLPSFTLTAKERQKSSPVRSLAVFLMIFCFIFSTLAQPVQAAVSVTDSETEIKEKNRTTMYVSSSLAGRHGLCVLLENVDSTGNKKYGLIDTGNANVSAAKAFLNKHGVKTLDFMILTHMHKDHVGNAVWIIKNYKVRQLYLKQFDAAWSDGEQSIYENILRAAITSPYVQQIHGVSYALSKNKAASPKASKSFISFLQSHANRKWRFKGLFKSSNTALYLGQTALRLFNWEIWSEDGTTLWDPLKNTRCKVQKFASDRSDNHFSMGVRVTRDNQKIWIGGDITNLRLKKKRHSAVKGDEDRLGRQIGKVNIAVLNHHGRGGSNSKAFLKALSPTYVVYTSAKGDITSGGSLALSTLNYIKNTMKLKENHILWAFDCWGTHREDLAITLSVNTLASAGKNSATKKSTGKNNPSKSNTLDKNDAKSNAAKAGSSGSSGSNAAKTGSTDSSAKASAGKGLVVSLLPGKSYSAYDLTGDGKKDVVSISGTKSGSAYKGLSVSINKKVVWSTKTSFKDSKPVTLVRLPGKQPYVCISILSPTGNNAAKGRVFGLFKYGNQGSSGSKYGLVQTYSFLKQMPVTRYTYKGAPAISCTARRITVVTSGSDTLSANAFVTFVLEQNKTGLKTVAAAFPYTTVKGKTGTVTLKAAAKLYSSADAVKNSSTLGKGKKVTVTGVLKNKKGTTRYRIIDSNKKVWWINAPAAAK